MLPVSQGLGTRGGRGRINGRRANSDVYKARWAVDASIRFRESTAAGCGWQVSDPNAQSRIDSI
jgi:hypothetical protein